MHLFVKPTLEVLEDRNAPGNLGYFLSCNFLDDYTTSSPKFTIQTYLTSDDLTDKPNTSILNRISNTESLEVAGSKSRISSPKAAIEAIESGHKSNYLESFENAFSNAQHSLSRTLLSGSVTDTTALILSGLVLSGTEGHRYFGNASNTALSSIENINIRTNALFNVLSQMTEHDEQMTPENLGGDPGDLGDPGQQPPEAPWEEQEVLINGNNDHGAAVVKYTGIRHINGQPAPQPNTIEYPGYIPVNYEYDYKVGAQSPTANPMYTDPQVMNIKWKQVGNSMPMDGFEYVKWKLTYTPPTDGIQRLRFWDSGKKLVQFQANKNYTYTAPVPPPSPLLNPHGIWPVAVEGIEISKVLKDAGEATLSLELVNPVINGVRAPSVFVNYKPVKFTVTPVLKSLQLGVESQQPMVYLDANLNQYMIGPKAKIHADFDTKGAPVAVTFVQFVNSVVNLADNGSKAIVTKPGSPMPSKKWDYGYNHPNPDPTINDLYRSQPNFDFPFLDAKPGDGAYPGYPSSLQGFDNSGSYYNRMTMKDDPALPASEWIDSVKYSVIFDTYVCAAFPNPNDVYKTVFLPIGKVSWKYTIDASNFTLNNGLLTATYGPMNQLSQNGSSSIYVHQFTGNQKLVTNIASLGYPLLNA